MRLRLVAIVVVALLLSGSATAYASWRRGAPVGAGTAVQSGTFGVTATWSTALNLTALYPGVARTGVLTVARTGNGRWIYTIGSPTTVGGVVRVFPTSACTGTPLTLPWTQTTVQAGTATPQHCVEFTANNPLQAGLVYNATVPVTAESRPTN